MSKKRQKIIDSLDLLYYEYNKTQNTLFIDKNSSCDDVGRELIKITYTLTKHDIEFFIDDEKNIIIECSDKFMSRMKHKFARLVKKVKNTSKHIYVLSDKKVEGAINLPMIEIAYIEQDVDLSHYDALVFTSKNAIKAINSMDDTWKKIPSYVIAPQTAKIVKSFQGNLVFTGKQKHGNEFAHEIKDQLKGKKVLYIGGTKVVSKLREILNENEVLCDHLAIYETVCKKYDSKITLPKHSIIIFSSPSTIECFLKNIHWGSTFQAVSIGKTTANYFPSYITPFISETTSLESCVKKAQELH